MVKISRHNKLHNQVIRQVNCDMAILEFPDLLLNYVISHRY
ncbi:hypothetical protein BN4901_1293 [Citrobacter europaeus]|uniref:Uncharacterized protein n=1 Tax=Citrobacter europaeus TaxID=1914243 RepID=A0ABY0JL40_9ENTR|nr:hypothetical protein BN4901_1293 [Citrobacter europaeus]